MKSVGSRPRFVTWLFFVLFVSFTRSREIHNVEPSLFHNREIDHTNSSQSQNKEINDDISNALKILNSKSYEMEFQIRYPNSRYSVMDFMHYPKYVWVDLEDENDPKIRFETYDHVGKRIFAKEGTFTRYSVDGRAICVMDSFSDDYKQNLQISIGTVWDRCQRISSESNENQCFECIEKGNSNPEKVQICMIDGKPITISVENKVSIHITTILLQKPIPEAFLLPQDCILNLDASDSKETDPITELQLRHLVPYIVKADPDYDAFLQRFERLLMTPIEYAFRMQNYVKWRKFIKNHNSKKDLSYKLEGNLHTDWSDEGFLYTRTGLIPNGVDTEAILTEKAVAFIPRKEEELPKAFSWYDTGAVVHVKDQGICSSSYAFAASAAMTAAWFFKYNETISFSEQQLVDCTWDFGNMGCTGGRPELALANVIENLLVPMTDSKYRYQGSDLIDQKLENEPSEGSCRSDGAEKFHGFSQMIMAGMNNLSKTKHALVDLGPLVVSIDPTPWEFRFYKSGIYSNPVCETSSKFMKHSVLLVGYGEENGKSYWLIKNSWGPNWGEKGYMKIDMDHDCGITTMPFAITIGKRFVGETARIHKFFLE